MWRESWDKQTDPCLLSRTSSCLGFILVSISTSVPIDTKTLLIFRHLYSPNFPSQPYSWRNSHFRHQFITAPWTILTLYLTDPFSQLNQPTNQRTAKKVSQGSGVKSCLSYHWLFSMTLLVNFWIDVFWILHLPYKNYRWTIHYITISEHSKQQSRGGDCSRGWPEGSLFISYYTEV